MKKIVFISDYFADEVIGGAELVDLEVYRYFSGNGYQTEKIHSYDNELIEQSLSHENYYIISNFT